MEGQYPDTNALVNNLLVILILLFGFIASLPIRAADGSEQRTVITVVPFTAGKETADHWRHSFASELRNRLDKTGTLRVRHPGFGMRRLELPSTATPTKDQALAIGLLVQAPSVLWGTVTTIGGKWMVSAAILEPASGREDPFRAEGADFWEARNNTIRQVAARLGVAVPAETADEVFKVWTSSAGALELSSEAHAAGLRKEHLSKAETLLLKAVALDPYSTRLWAALAHLYITMDRSGEAGDALIRALDLDPDNTDALYVRAIHELEQDQHPALIATLERILELDPEKVDALRLMARVRSRVKDDLEGALELLRRARRIAPMDGRIHGQEALVLARSGKRKEAGIALGEAVRLIMGEDPPTDGLFTIAHAAVFMGDRILALGVLRRAVAVLQKQGASPSTIAWAQRTIAMLEAREEAVAVEFDIPRTYTDKQLGDAITSRLDEDEREGIESPLVVTPGMVAWARDAVAGADGERATAKALFTVMNRRAPHVGDLGARTAREVFAAWGDPLETFSCQEYAKLYVGLARELGLEAFFVLVERDDADKPVMHACAAVRAEGEWFLADPTYDWFGIRHRDFTVLDDLQATGIHYSQIRDDDGFMTEAANMHPEALARRRLATKLFPENVHARVALARHLIQQNDLEGAERELDAATRLGQPKCQLYATRAFLAMRRNDLDRTEEYSQKALDLNPHRAQSHAAMGIVQQQRGRLAEARESFQKALSQTGEPDEERTILRWIARIDDQIGPGEDGPVARALRMWKEGNLEGAVEELKVAVEQEPHRFANHFRLGKCLHELERREEALPHLRRAIELDPDDHMTRSLLSDVLFKAGKPGQSLEVMKGGLELDPGNPNLLVELGSLQFRSGDKSNAVATWEQAIAAGSDNPRVYITLARELALRMRSREAARILEEAKEMVVTDSSGLLNAAGSWLMVGRFEEARHYFRLALDASGTNDGSPVSEAVRDHFQANLDAAFAMEEDLLDQIRQGGEPAFDEAGIEKLGFVQGSLRESIDPSELGPCFEQHRDKVRDQLEERAVTTITLDTGPDALKHATAIRDALRAGRSPNEAAGDQGTVRRRQWLSREGLQGAMRAPVFDTPVGGVCEVVDGGSFLAVSIVHATRPGKGGTLKDAHVRDAVRNVILRQKLELWWEYYLGILKDRVRNEAAGEAAGPPPQG